MIRRDAKEAVGDQIVRRTKQGSRPQLNDNAIAMRWLILSKLKHAVRKRALLAAIFVLVAFILVVVTARHVGRHIRNTCHRRKRRLLRGRWNCQRLRNESGDHEDRQQTTYESVKKHGLSVAWNPRFWKVNCFTSRQRGFRQVKAPQNQMVNPACGAE